MAKSPLLCHHGIIHPLPGTVKTTFDPSVEPSKSFVRGFSLTELLIAIGLLLLLTLMAIPIMKAVNQSAGGTRCLSNLRQLGGAFHHYAAEHRGVLAFHFYTIPASTIRWSDYLITGGYLSKDASAMVCASAKPGAFAGSGFVYGGIGRTEVNDPYSFVPPGGTVEGRQIRLSAIAEPSRYWLLADSWSKTHQSQIYFISKNASTSFGVHLRHRDAANFLFADGHVAPLTKGQAKELPYHPLLWGFNEKGVSITF